MINGLDSNYDINLDDINFLGNSIISDYIIND